MPYLMKIKLLKEVLNMKKLKEILQAVAFLLIGIPIMIMASISDQRAFKKEREQRQKSQEQNR